MTHKNPLLELTTTIERNTIQVDGKEYEIRNLDEFSLAERNQCIAHGKRLSALFNSEKIEEKQANELSVGLNDLFRKMVVAEAEELSKKLNDGQKLKVLTAFLTQDAKAAETKASTEAPSNILPD